MKKLAIVGLMASVLVFTGTTAQAVGNQELHGNPYTFLFGNHIDTHQETKLQNDGSLTGRFYIYYTGDIDLASGLPVARHPRGPGQHNEECGVDPIDCVVGWHIRALPAEAVFLSHSGVNGDDHPIWMISTRTGIPQPGSYTHFHWITNASTDDRRETVPAECDVQMAGELEGTVDTGTLTFVGAVVADAWTVDVHVGGGAEGLVCPGWLLQITAIREFAFLHSGERIPVAPGVDNSTHFNIVTNYAIIPFLTGGGGGGHSAD